MRISDWSSDVCSSDLGGQSTACLALAEGFETARAFTLLQGLPCWASLGARRLNQVLLPHSLTSLILAVDNDAEGARDAARATFRYAMPGLEYPRTAPSRYKARATSMEAALEPLGGRR